MAKRASMTSDLLTPKGKAQPAAKVSKAGTSDRRTALTVKLDADRYEQLRRYAFEHRLSHQEVMVAALDAFLKLRLHLHRSQAEMGALLGISRQAWSLYETGQRIPNAERIGELALSCGVSTDWLILGKGDLHHKGWNL